MQNRLRNAANLQTVITAGYFACLTGWDRRFSFLGQGHLCAGSIAAAEIIRHKQIRVARNPKLLARNHKTIFRLFSNLSAAILSGSLPALSEDC
jgi:hypothetical protein